MSSLAAGIVPLARHWGITGRNDILGGTQVRAPGGGLVGALIMEPGTKIDRESLRDPTEIAGRLFGTKLAIKEVSGAPTGTVMDAKALRQWSRTGKGAGVIPFDALPKGIREKTGAVLADMTPVGWDVGALSDDEAWLLRHLLSPERK